MRTRSKLIMAGMCASLLLAFAVGTASANELAVSEENFTIEWSPLNFIAGGTTTSCDVTLDGTFHELEIAKVEEALIGNITGASVANCLNGGAATVLTGDLPWHVVYYEFEGALPNIESVTLGLIGAAFRVDPAGITPACLAATEAGEPGVGIAALDEEGIASTLAADALASIDLDGGFICDIAGDSQFSGTGAVDPPLTIELV